MQQVQRSARAVSHVRRLAVSSMAVVALALTAQAAFAVGGTQPKPQLNVETERSPEGAKPTYNGESGAPVARTKLAGTRPAAGARPQQFGTFSAHSTGALTGRAVAQCSTDNMDVGSAEHVTITATDSATSVKVSTRVQGGAWVCQ